MPKILLVVDNSNIHVQTIKSFGKDARFSYPNFEKNFYGSDSFVAKQITGSTPPSIDSFWDRMRREGYEVTTYERKQNFCRGTTEKGVDTAIVARATEAIVNLKPDVLVLFSGDLDMKPLVEMAKKYSCTVHIWTFNESSSSDLEKECDKIYYIDDYINDLIYFQDIQGNKESFREHEERIALEKQKAKEYSRREANYYDDEKDNQDMPTWLKVLIGCGITSACIGLLRLINRRQS